MGLLRMDRKSLIVVMLVAAVGLIVFNLSMKRDRYQDSREISGYEYARLHTVALTAEAEAVSEDLNHERVTIAEYNKIMSRLERVRYQKEQQEAALEHSTKLAASRFLRRNIH